MDLFAKNLKSRAKTLRLSDAEVAERAGLDARRYGHYVTGRNEPDLATLIRIATVLETTPNLLLNFDGDVTSSKLERLMASARHLNDSQLDMLIDFAEASLKK